MGEEEAALEEQSTVEQGREFEIELEEFLKKMGCTDVDGGPKCYFGPEGNQDQVDACGRWKDILFIVSCTSAKRKSKKPKSLKTKMLAWNKIVERVKKSYKLRAEYETCTTVVPIFATKKIILPEKQEMLLETDKEGQRHYIDEDFLDYYNELFEKIGEYAVYNILSEFSIEPRPGDTLEAIAIKTNIKGIGAYLFYARPNDLLKFARVARREEKKEEFYQRSVDGHRLRKIANFLESGGMFPNNVILSIREKYCHSYYYSKKAAQDIRNFPEDLQVGMLRIYRKYGCCWVIDGQHRLYSFSKTKDESRIPCILLTDIPYQKERSFFLEINKEQRKVPPDLVWDLEGEADPECKKDAGLISNTVRMIDACPFAKESSPFDGKIYIPVNGSAEGKMITMSAFCNAIKNSGITNEITTNSVGAKNPLFDENKNTMKNRIAKTIRKFFASLDEKIENKNHKKFLFGNAGVPIMLYLLEPILANIGCIPQKTQISPFAENIKKYFEENYPSEEDQRALRLSTTNEGSRKLEARKIGQFIRKERGFSEADFWPKMKTDERLDDVVSIERKIGRLISKKLSGISANWRKERVPQDAIAEVKRNMKSFPDLDFDECLSLGNELNIILRKDNWEQVFEEFFTEKGIFRNAEDLKVAIGYLGKVRTPKAHGPRQLQKTDLDICDAYIEKFEQLFGELEEENSE